MINVIMWVDGALLAGGSILKVENVGFYLQNGRNTRNLGQKDDENLLTTVHMILETAS